MPKKTSNSELLQKLGERGQKSFEKHKRDETIFDTSGQLPAGIEGGIAQLVSCKFGIYAKGKDKGKPFFTATGVVKHPEEFNGERLAGGHTKIGPEPMCDTPTRSRKTFDEHMAWVINQLQLLGVITSDIEFLGDLDGILILLQDQKPHFRFRTWKGEKQTEGPFAGREPNTQEVWQGQVDYTDDEDDGVVDETVEVEEEEEEEVPFETTSETTYDSINSNDLDALAIAADADDTDAQEKLQEKAKLLGIGKDAVNATGDWSEVVEMIQNAESSESNAESSESNAEELLPNFSELAKQADADDAEAEALLTKAAEDRGLDPDEYETWSELSEELEKASPVAKSDEFIPVGGNCVWYKPPKRRKRYEFEVKAVFDGKKTCNLKDLDDSKSYKSVSWSEVFENEE